MPSIGNSACGCTNDNPSIGNGACSSATTTEKVTLNYTTIPSFTKYDIGFTEVYPLSSNATLTSGSVYPVNTTAISLPVGVYQVQITAGFLTPTAGSTTINAVTIGIANNNTTLPSVVATTSFKSAKLHNGWTLDFGLSSNGAQVTWNTVLKLTTASTSIYGLVAPYFTAGANQPLLTATNSYVQITRVA